jgi:hypothetical protein
MKVWRRYSLDWRNGDDASPAADRAGPDARKRLADVPETEGVRALVRVRLPPGASKQNFEEYLLALLPVQCAWHMTGEADYELLVSCPVIADLGSLLACLRGSGGAEMTSAGLVLREVPGLGAPHHPASGIPAARRAR